MCGQRLTGLTLIMMMTLAILMAKTVTHQKTRQTSLPPRGKQGRRTVAAGLFCHGHVSTETRRLLIHPASKAICCQAVHNRVMHMAQKKQTRPLHAEILEALRANQATGSSHNKPPASGGLTTGSIPTNPSHVSTDSVPRILEFIGWRETNHRALDLHTIMPTATSERSSPAGPGSGSSLTELSSSPCNSPVRPCYPPRPETALSSPGNDACLPSLSG